VNSFYYWIISALFFIAAVNSSTEAYAVDFSAEAGIESLYTSNVFLNSDETWDLSLAPQLSLNLDFADYWTAGYDGGLSVYTRNSDLFSHNHTLFLLANPAWGSDSQNEFFGQLSLNTQRHTDTYASINVLQPALDAGLTLEPVIWFRWLLSEYLDYSWFYDEKSSNYLESWSRMSLQFTLQSRTTISPYFAYGYRYYLKKSTSGTGTSSDNQLKPGIHISQGLWKDAGIQLDYAYLYALEASGLIARKQDSVEFDYLDEAFLFSGHQASIGFKQLFAKSWIFILGAGIEERKYAGWPVLDANGTATGEERRDLRLPLFTGMEYTWIPPEEASSAVPGVKVNLNYAYMRQWSSDDWYDSDQHNISLGVWLNW